MMSVLVSLLRTRRGCLRSRAALQLEVLALRHQLHVLERSRSRRLGLTRADRLLWVWVSRVWNDWRATLVIVRPETEVAWHRRGFRLFWTWKSRRRLGRSTVPADVPTLIPSMSDANPLWGAPRMHGELLKLGIQIGQASVAKYMVRHRRPPSQTWRSFLRNHLSQIMAADFFVVPTASCTSPSPRIQSRRGRRSNCVTHSRGTRPLDSGSTIATVPSPTRRRSACTKYSRHRDRLIGSIRRECLDHVIIVNAAGLRRVLAAYIEYYNASRTHLALEKDAPLRRSIAPPTIGHVVAISQVGGLHHRYERRAA